jgi:hypothetical protein
MGVALHRPQAFLIPCVKQYFHNRKIILNDALDFEGISNLKKNINTNFNKGKFLYFFGTPDKRDLKNASEQTKAQISIPRCSKTRHWRRELGRDAL